MYVIDDDKEDFEVPLASYTSTTLKRSKHIRDNRWGHILHTMAVVATQIPSCIKYKENGDTTATCLDDMFFLKLFQVRPHHLI